MARISELHYSNAYANSSGVNEFIEIALGVGEDPADFVVSFYHSDGAFGDEFTLDDPRIVFSVDPENGEFIYVLSADNLPILLTDPDGGGGTNYDAYALTDTTTVPGTVIDFYDIGGGTQNIVAQGGAADAAVSTNVPVPTGPNTTTTTIQWNQPDPDTISYETVGPGDTGLACFTAGTLMDTYEGPRLVETLRPGDLIPTLDGGSQPLRWIGTRQVSGTGAYAPILIRAGTLGANQDIFVSPQHRILLSGWHAEILFGTFEVLVAAKSLVNDMTILRVPQAHVTYVHLLFDAHEIVTAQGLQSESFLPGRYIMSKLDHDVEAEILDLFPEMKDYGPAARRICSGLEAQIICQNGAMTL